MMRKSFVKTISRQWNSKTPEGLGSSHAPNRLATILASPIMLQQANIILKKKTAPEVNQARFRENLEAEARIELANTGFANPRLTTWLLRPRATS